MIRTRNVRRLWNSFSKLFIGFGSWKTPTGKQVPKALNRRNVGLEQLETRWMPATAIFDGVSTLTITLEDNENIEAITYPATPNAINYFINGGTFDPTTSNLAGTNLVIDGFDERLYTGGSNPVSSNVTSIVFTSANGALASNVRVQFGTSSDVYNNPQSSIDLNNLTDIHKQYKSIK